jgi:predicted Rossmann fold flavoprotein
MEQVSKSYDVIIIGGGPAGIMAAISVKHHHPDYSVLIIDSNKELGRKLVISGAGRGNLTNINLKNYPEKFYQGNFSLISSVFSQFTYQQILDFFEKLGILVFEEKKNGKGKIFPEIENAKTIREILVEYIKTLGTEFSLQTSIQNISFKNQIWETQTQNNIFTSRNIILSTGGQTYPALGSNGSGYDLAKKLGHTIIFPVPSAVPLVSKNMLSHYLQGEKIEMDVKITIDAKVSGHSIGEVIFTQYGFSGPAIFDVSREVSVRINREKKSGVAIQLSFFPNKTITEIESLLSERWQKNPQQLVSVSLWGLLTMKVAGAVCAVSDVPKDKHVRDLTQTEIQQILKTLFLFETSITATRGWNEAEFTAGGVNTQEINSVTLESLIAPGLYFAGEILDVDGPVGGFNLSWAWASGWVAGKFSHS